MLVLGLAENDYAPQGGPHRMRTLKPEAATVQRLEVITGDVAPYSYPFAIGVRPSVLPSWAVVAAVRGAEPSVERSAADRRCAA